MLTHDDVWRGIDRLAASFGYSPSGLAKQAGLDPTSFNKSKRITPQGKARWPSTESVAKVLAVTGATMSDFIALIGKENNQTYDSPFPRYIPVIGFGQAGEDGFFDTDGYPKGDAWDEIRFPDTAYKDVGQVYALEVSGDSMEPLYREGDRLIVSPSEKLRRGDRVIVKTTSGEIMAKELKRQNNKLVELRSLNPHYEDRSLGRDEVDWIARVLWVSQ